MSAAVSLDAVLDLLAEKVAERLRVTSPTSAADFVDQGSCGFDRKTFVRAARAGEFPASKVGRRWIAKRADVSAWLDSKRPALKVANETDVDDLRSKLGLKGVRRAS